VLGFSAVLSFWAAWGGLQLLRGLASEFAWDGLS
jgi:hypothetical protein